MKKLSNKNESGLVSIVVVLLLMIMLGLITAAFSKITRREQRQALDREISTQAFYASETGVNDAINAVKNKPLLSDRDFTTNCDSGHPDNFMSAANANLNGVVDSSGGNSRYTCLFVDPTPQGFKFSNIDTNNSKIFPITPGGGDALKKVDSINIGWQDKEGGSVISTCNNSLTFPAANAWPANCNTGVLRVDLVPVYTGSPYTRAELLDKTITIFLYPHSSNGVYEATSASLTGGLGTQGRIIQVKCDQPSVPEKCNFKITNLPNTQISYMMRLKSIYRSSTASVIAYDNSATPKALELKDGQAVVDSTGKNTDVLRRIQVRVPLKNFSNAPEFAAQTVDSICKRFWVSPAPSPDDYGYDSSYDIVGPPSQKPCDVIAP